MCVRLDARYLLHDSEQRGFPSSSVDKGSTCNAEDPGSIPGQEDRLEKDRLPTPVFLGL